MRSPFSRARRGVQTAGPERRRARPALAPLTAVAAALVVVSFLRLAPNPDGPAKARPDGGELLTQVPVAFVANVGQWQHAARYVARIGTTTVFLERDGWTLRLAGASDSDRGRGVAVRMTFAGADAKELLPEGQLPGHHNYLLGQATSGWHTGVPLYRAVRYRGLHPGVDLRAREHAGHFEFDLLLEPGAAPEAVEVEVEGIEGMRLDDDGALVLETLLGCLRMPRPRTWQEGPAGERVPIACRYVLSGASRFGFTVPGRRTGWGLVIDPGLVWSTFVGGWGTRGRSHDAAYAIALDGQGDITIAGEAVSWDFPTTSGSFDTTHNGASDAFVVRLSPSGARLVYATFLGGRNADVASAIAVDAQGATTVTGPTWSTDFPLVKAYDATHSGGVDAFVARLSPSGASLDYSTYLGSDGTDWASAVAVDGQGAATVAGYTSSTNYPTTANAFDRKHNGQNDGFVTRLTASGASLVYSTFLGGSRRDEVHSIHVDSLGVATVAGVTQSTDFPIRGRAYDTTHNGGSDGFVARVSPFGRTLTYSTFLGGTRNDEAMAVAVDARGAVTVVGGTGSADFPVTQGAYDTKFGGRDDAFVARLSPSGAALDYSTFLGGPGGEWAFALALGPAASVTVVGHADAAGYPTTAGAFDASHNWGIDAFVARISPSGAALQYSTYLGGDNDDLARGVALDERGGATVAGFTRSTNFPVTAGAFDTTHNAGFDAFVTRFDMLPTGVEAFGDSSPGCNGPLAIGVTAMPRIGNTAFALTCGNAPASSGGGLVIGAGPLATPLVVAGARLWIDPRAGWMVVPLPSNAMGGANAALPIPNDPALVRARLFAQFFWIGPNAPKPCPPLGVSASNALVVAIQP